MPNTHKLALFKGYKIERAMKLKFDGNLSDIYLNDYKMFITDLKHKGFLGVRRLGDELYLKAIQVFDCSRRRA